MRKITFFRNLIVLVALLVGSGSAYSADETYTYTTGDGTWITENTIRTYESANFTILHRKNNSSTNIATTYTELRVYQYHSMEIYPAIAGKRITSVEVTASTAAYATAMGNATILAGTSEGTAASVTGVASVNGSVATFDLSGVTGCEYVKFSLSAQSRTLSWKITYETGGAPTVATPVIEVTDGVAKSTDTYFNSAEVTITSATEGASIYYTTNGDAPTTASTLYVDPFTITSTTTIKALAVKAEMDDSGIASKTITIVAPATATVPYSEAFNNTLGDWYPYEVAGAKPWVASANGAIGNGYSNPNADIESWLISPKFTATEDGLALSFNYASRYVGNPLLVKVSTNYIGYGSPAAATWTTAATILAPEVQDNDYTVKASGSIIHASAGTVYYALVYDNDAAPYSDWRITNASVILPPTGPTISVVEADIPEMSAYVDASDSETITVNGVNLTTDITLSLGGADAAQFRLSTSTLAQTDGSVTDASVTIYYEPKASGSHIATLTLSSNGATDVTRTLNGEVIEPITAPNVIITEVYGGGGNSGATYTHDFFELYNTTENSVTIGGWSIQYYAATGTGASSNVIVIPDGKYIPAKSHFLIQSASGGAVGVALPTPDATGTVNAAAAAGKVILYTTNAAQTINSSDITSITGNGFFKDYVPFGTTATPVWGSAMSSGASNTTSATRKKVEGEYVYTQNIGNDFEVASPNPQNTGIVSSTDNPSSPTNIYAHNANIHFTATAGEKVEVYNAVGQKIISTLATDGQNELPVNAKGVMIVKVGSRLAKVIL